jgi:ribosome biogenesis GTPase
LERYLTVTAESGAAPVVVLNKADVCSDVPERTAKAREVAAGAPVVTCSALEASTLEQLTPFLEPGRTVALLGSSGVGKSTIVNCLISEQRLRTSEVIASTSRGRHTTTHRELVLLPGGGILIDTPGMRELQLWAGEESVESTFDEIAELAVSCRYRDCSHTAEPGCAVQAAVNDGAILPERLHSFHKLMSEARRHEATIDALAAQEQKRKLKQLHRAAKLHYKLKRS